MKLTEEQISLAAKMYASRKSCISLFGLNGFREKVGEYRPIIEAAMKKHQCDELHAAIEILQVLVNGGSGGVPAMLVLATVVEMIEPQMEAVN